MGCGSSSSLMFEIEKEKVQNTRFENALPISWKGSFPGNTFTVVKDPAHTKDGGLLQDQSGNTILEIRQSKDHKYQTFLEPGTGKVILQMSLIHFGNFWTGKQSLWHLYTGENVAGGPMEVTATGNSLYRLGSIRQRMKMSAPGIEYIVGPELTDSSVCAMRCKFHSGSKLSVYGPNDPAGKTPGAVIENVRFDIQSGTMTYSQGFDPLVAFLLVYVNQMMASAA